MPETNFFWDPLSDNILQERDETGAVTAEYTTEPGLYGNLISQNRVGTESQYHFDAQGSTLALTDDNQPVSDSYGYTAFGEVTEHAGTMVNRFQYLGRRRYYEDDITGDVLSPGRSFSPRNGRWLSSQDSGKIFFISSHFAFNPGDAVLPSAIHSLGAHVIQGGDRDALSPYHFASIPYDDPWWQYFHALRWYREQLRIRELIRGLLSLGPIPCSQLHFSISRPTAVGFFRMGRCRETVFERHVPILIQRLIGERIDVLTPCPTQCNCNIIRTDSVEIPVAIPFMATFWFRIRTPNIEFSFKELPGFDGPCTAIVLAFFKAIAALEVGTCALGPPPPVPVQGNRILTRCGEDS